MGANAQRTAKVPSAAKKAAILSDHTMHNPCIDTSNACTVLVQEQSTPIKGSHLMRFRASFIIFAYRCPWRPNEARGLRRSGWLLRSRDPPAQVRHFRPAVMRNVRSHSR